ncbi:MAG: hypothetical protein AMXMBFR84_50410 [Candidatus Hydrogenedentota bacterium]
MSHLHQQRCFNHALREAAAKCRECGRFYCRECVTEHENRLVCSACLARSVSAKVSTRHRLRIALQIMNSVAILLLLWFGFFLLGNGLLQVPSTFHETLLESWIDEDAPE